MWRRPQQTTLICKRPKPQDKTTEADDRSILSVLYNNWSQEGSCITAEIYTFMCGRNDLKSLFWSQILWTDEAKIYLYVQKKKRRKEILVVVQGFETNENKAEF